MGNDINAMCASTYVNIKKDTEQSRVEVQKCIDFLMNQP